MRNPGDKSARICENNNHSHPLDAPSNGALNHHAIGLRRPFFAFVTGFLACPHSRSITVPHPTVASLTLDHTTVGQRCIVQDVTSPAAAPEWARWLDEIGFTPGEQVMLMARGAFGGDPLVVRVGTSTFALRRAEAACVRVEAAAA